MLITMRISAAIAINGQRYGSSAGCRTVPWESLQKLFSLGPKVKSKSEVVRRSCQTHCETTRPTRPTKDVDALKYAGQKKSKKKKKIKISRSWSEMWTPRSVRDSGAGEPAMLLLLLLVACSAAPQWSALLLCPAPQVSRRLNSTPTHVQTARRSQIPPKPSTPRPRSAE